jgi:hypothetical protein
MANLAPAERRVVAHRINELNATVSDLTNPAPPGTGLSKHWGIMPP